MAEANEPMQRLLPRNRRWPGGLTIVELLVSVAVGLLVVLAASALLLSSKSNYLLQDDASRMDENARFALEAFGRAVRQAGFVGRDTTATLPAGFTDMPSILGLDASAVIRTAPDISSPLPSQVNHSDVLAVRYGGSGDGEGDGSILNCAGFPVPAAAAGENPMQGWSIFYVAPDAGGEPQLYCKYRGSHGWSSEALVRGVESFQVLYGIDADRDGVPERMLPANAVGAAAADGVATPWSSVAMVHVALLLRGVSKVDTDLAQRTFQLFGKEYADSAADDRGVSIDTRSLPPHLRHRMRKVYSTSIRVRNVHDGGRR